MPHQTEEQFRAATLEGVDRLNQRQAELITNYENLTKETKRAFEELTAVKSGVNSQQEILKKLQGAQLQLSRERRMAFDPVARLVNDEERVRSFLAAVLMGAGVKQLPDSLQPHAKALSEGATPGSTLIQGETARDVYDVLSTYGVWNTFGVRAVGTQTNTLPIQTARTVASWLNTQGGQISEDSTKAGSTVTLTVRTMGVLLGVTRELLDDAIVDVAADVLNDFGQACAYRLDWSCLAADGTNDVTDGNYTGIFSGGTAAGAGSGNTTVSELTLDDFVRCLTTVAASVLRRSARWWIHPTILAKICLIRDENGRPIFQTALEAPAPGSIGSILGYPVVLADAAPNTDAAGNVVAVFGDPQGLAVGIRKAFEFAKSEDHLFDYNQIAYRGLVRAGVIIRAATAFAKLTTAAA